MDIEKSLQNIAKKSGKPIEELREEYNTALANTPPGPLQESKVLKDLNRKHAIRSPAVSYEGIIIGIGQLVDFNKTKVAEANEAYQANEQDAIERGLVKVEGDRVIILDTRKDFGEGKKNDNFGKELKESLNRPCVTLIKQDDGYKLGFLNLRNNIAKGPLPPRNALLQFRANGTVEEGLRTSDVATVFKTQEVISSESLNELIMQYGESNIKILGDCFDYHRALPERTPEFYNRFVITTGNVSFVKPSEDPEKSHFLVLDDPSVDKPISCFLAYNVDIPEQNSEITLVAQTGIGKGWDSEKKEQTDEDVLNLNIMGIIPQ